MRDKKETVEKKHDGTKLTEQRVNELSAILTISNYVGSVMQVDDILNIITRETAEVMDANVSSIYLYNKKMTRLILKATYGLNPKCINVTGFAPGKGLPGWVIENNQTVALSDAHTDPRFSPLAEDSHEQNLKAYLGAPLRIQEEIVGVMTVRKTSGYCFTQEEITFFETICKQVAIVIEKSRLYFEKLEVERLAAVGQSLSETAHYIKNILQSMKGGSFFIESGLKRNDTQRVRRGWDVLKTSNRKIADLVKNMLGFSRTTKPQIKPAELNTLILEILTSLEDTTNYRGVDIEPVLDPDLPELRLDVDSIQDALLNIITNAIDSIPQKRKGRIVISTIHDRKKGQVVCEISDDGEGISEDNMQNIFNLFFTTKGTHGTGIGLAVTKKIIEEHGGEIEVDSEVGKGSTFRVLLPVHNH